MFEERLEILGHRLVVEEIDPYLPRVSVKDTFEEPAPISKN
jgi:hypothetical protein